MLLEARTPGALPRRDPQSSKVPVLGAATLVYGVASPPLVRGPGVSNTPDIQGNHSTGLCLGYLGSGRIRSWSCNKRDEKGELVKLGWFIDGEQAPLLAEADGKAGELIHLDQSRVCPTTGNMVAESLRALGPTWLDEIRDLRVEVRFGPVVITPYFWPNGQDLRERTAPAQVSDTAGRHDDHRHGDADFGIR